jgi:hypothetical protein
LEKLQTTLIAMVGMICVFSGALQGDKIPRADLGRIGEHLLERLGRPQKPHVTLVLRGQFIGHKFNQDYLLPLAPMTKSGLEN